MKTHREITELICAPHCRFYKPGEKEELSCGGYDFFIGVIDDSVVAEAARTISENTRPPERFDHDVRIEGIICSRCEFRQEDCDFMSCEDVPNAVPCGGYVLLKRLLAAGLQQAEDWINERS